MAGYKSQTCSYRVWYIYLQFARPSVFFHSAHFWLWCTFCTKLVMSAEEPFNFSLWYLVFRTNLNQLGPIKIQWSSLVLCIFLTLSNNVEEVATLFFVVQPFTTKAGGGMRAKLTAWCSKNLRQKLCNCGYGVPNHE